MSDAVRLRRVSGLVETHRTLNLEVVRSNPADSHTGFFFDLQI